MQEKKYGLIVNWGSKIDEKLFNEKFLKRKNNLHNKVLQVLKEKKHKKQLWGKAFGIWGEKS